MTLTGLRRQIDQLDRRLLRLLNIRGRRVRSIGRLKKREGRAIFAPHRETDVLHRLKQLNHGPLPPEAVEGVFREIVNACRSLQRRHRVAYLGPQATFTHLAAVQCFGRYEEFFSCRSIADVFDEVEKSRADYGVVPIENSTEGVVNHTLDMFIESDLKICAERELQISHYLLASPRVRGLQGIRRLYSHPQALAQCRQWMEAHLPEIRVIESASTAEAAQRAARDPHSAAIAARVAAEIYGLETLASRIEDEVNNFTRFLVIGRTVSERTGRDKTSILFSIKDRVGALHDMLLPFKRDGINLTKIESRPTRRKAWQYIFFVDFIGHVTERRVQRALERLERDCSQLKILGSYPRSE